MSPTTGRKTSTKTKKRYENMKMKSQLGFSPFASLVFSVFSCEVGLEDTDPTQHASNPLGRYMPGPVTWNVQIKYFVIKANSKFVGPILWLAEMMGNLSSLSLWIIGMIYYFLPIIQTHPKSEMGHRVIKLSINPCCLAVLGPIDNRVSRKPFGSMLGSTKSEASTWPIYIPALKIHNDMARPIDIHILYQLIRVFYQKIIIIIKEKKLIGVSGGRDRATWA